MSRKVKLRALVLFITIASIVVIFAILIAKYYMFNDAVNKEETNSAYEQFKTNTTLIEGKVDAKYIQNFGGKKVRYLSIYDNGDSSKLVSVSEEQFHEYKRGSKVNFRIDRASNNAVVVDLDKHQDIKSEEAFHKYKKQL